MIETFYFSFNQLNEVKGRDELEANFRTFLLEIRPTVTLTDNYQSNFDDRMTMIEFWFKILFNELKDSKELNLNATSTLKAFYPSYSSEDNYLKKLNGLVFSGTKENI